MALLKQDSPSVVPQSVWDKKDKAIQTGGLFHDAAEITAALVMAHGLKTEQAIQTFEQVLTGVIAARTKIEA